MRYAVPEDGASISRLYNEAYTPEGSGDASASYPFPQFLVPRWVSGAVTDQRIRWIVATVGRQVVGTLGALRNVGAHSDGVAEFFGLVVAEPFRGRGIGNLLMTRLCEILDPETRVMIAETRTADPRGWLSARRSGFFPLGFEPFAHTTPAGLEPMLLLGRIAPEAGEAAIGLAPQSRQAGRLAETILGNSGLATERRNSSRSAEPDYAPSLQHGLDAIRDDVRGPGLLESIRSPSRHSSGVVDLDRLQGEDPAGRRYENAYFVGLLGSEPVACLHVSWDRCDLRARILRLRTSLPGAQSILVSRACAWLEARSEGIPVSVVLDVRADQPRLLASLEELGFFPTLYYPSLVQGEEGRVDAVQFTWLAGHSVEDQSQWPAGLNWPAADKTVAVVSALARHAALRGAHATAEAQEGLFRSVSTRGGPA